MSVAVVGAGIMGLSSAVSIQKMEPRAKVTIFAESFSPDTTGDIAAGLWRPVYVNADPTKLRVWCQETFSLLQDLNKTDPLKYGVGLQSGFDLIAEEEHPFWSDMVFNFRHLSSRELVDLGFGSFKKGNFYTTFFLEPTPYLKYLLNEFTNNDGKIVKRKINNFNDISNDYDVIMNCSGLGARHLANDDQCFPIRGQVYRVNAPFVKHFVCSLDNYILLNSNTVILGGTHQENNWSTKINAADSKSIWDGCLKLMPSLEKCTILQQRVGLRPGRTCVRVEGEQFKVNNKTIPVVHCYGHGGSGFVLFHGCSQEAASLCRDALRQKILSSL